MTIDYKALGAKIKEYRKKENITQEQLSLLNNQQTLLLRILLLMVKQYLIMLHITL